MPRKQLKRIIEVDQFPFVFNVNIGKTEALYQEYFSNNKPITLELACGGGEYTVGLARLFPDRNFIGIDLKGHRIWHGANSVIDDNLKNIAFIKGNIELIGGVFKPGEIEEIWITFPDPFPKRYQSHRRLTSPDYLKKYKKLLIPGGTINLKTDSDLFFESTLKSIGSSRFKILKRIDNIHNGGDIDDILMIQTKYEKRHIKAGRTIKYLKFAP
jgi:tRNA (guanine-N7-)-methyltransferase